MSPITGINKGRKWLRTAVLVISIVSLSVGLVYLLRYLETYLRVSLEGFAPWAYLIVFVATLLSSSTIIIPAPGALIMLAAAAKWNPAIVAVVGSVGGTLGELTGYYAGHLVRKAIITEHAERYNQAVGWMNRYGLRAVFFFALVPILLFDLVGLVAGTLKLPVGKFLAACWAGRLPRSFFECYIGGGLFHLLFPSWFS